MTAFRVALAACLVIPALGSAATTELRFLRDGAVVNEIDLETLKKKCELAAVVIEASAVIAGGVGARTNAGSAATSTLNPLLTVSGSATYIAVGMVAGRVAYGNGLGKTSEHCWHWTMVVSRPRP